MATLVAHFYYSLLGELYLELIACVFLFGYKNKPEEEWARVFSSVEEPVKSSSPLVGTMQLSQLGIDHVQNVYNFL